MEKVLVQKVVKVVGLVRPVVHLEVMLLELLIVLMEHQENMLVEVDQVKELLTQFHQEQTVDLVVLIKVLLVVLG
jgi:hypothetical protein